MFQRQMCYPQGASFFTLANYISTIAVQELQLYLCNSCFHNTVMDAAGFSEASADIYQSTDPRIPESNNLNCSTILCVFVGAEKIFDCSGSSCYSTTVCLCAISRFRFFPSPMKTNSETSYKFIPSWKLNTIFPITTKKH